MRQKKTRGITERDKKATTSRCIIRGWSGRRNHQTKTTLRVKQVVNYRVNLKAGEADNPEDKDGKHRDEPASCLQREKTSDRD